MNAIQEQLEREIETGQRCANCQKFLSPPPPAHRGLRLCYACAQAGVKLARPLEIQRTSEATCSSAEVCRRNRWKPGTRLVTRPGDPHPSALQITAFGVKLVLAIEIFEDASRGEEGQIDLTLRDWMEVLS